MKKNLLIVWVFMLSSLPAISQNTKPSYPVPEYSNEIYLLMRADSTTLMRLEKGSSKMESKMKMGGFGGAESGYEMEGETSAVRLGSRNNLSFVFFNGGIEKKSSPYMDSVMKANNIDPATLKAMGMSGSDPSSSITLYKMTVEKGKRKIILQKSPGAFGGKKASSSDKYSFSVKKIREGYWELVVDKTLPKGEYAFSMMGMGMGNMDGSISLFAFTAD